jgi:glycoprotein-N-acetylgalactosamine 3-beta-galactosyltransferase
MPSHFATRAQAVNDTWGKRCDTLLFVSTTSNISTNLRTVTFDLGKESRMILTNKTMLAFEYIYKNHFDDADWFLKADDDTYVIMENLHHHLRGYDPEERHYYGVQYGHHGKAWFSGGAGYILSKAALHLYMTEGRYNDTRCPWDSAEDYYMGTCLESLGMPVDNRLHNFGFGGTLLSYFGNAKRYKTRRKVFSFHYNTLEQLYLYEFMVYNLEVNRDKHRSID